MLNFKFYNYLKYFQLIDFVQSFMFNVEGNLSPEEENIKKIFVDFLIVKIF